MEKKRFFAHHAKSSAMVVSLAVHAGIIAIAILVVVAKVILPEDPEFQVKKVKRLKMPPKKIQVPVDMKNRGPKPRLRKRIVSLQKTFVDIKMPEISGVTDGLGNMGGDGLGGLGFDLNLDLFGRDTFGGNELTGTFYDLKMTKYGKSTEMTDMKYVAALIRFSKGWYQSRLDDYFKAPSEKYASFFMTPYMEADAAPKAYGVENIVQPKHWVAYYKGRFAAPESGYYRFCGIADDVLLVRVDERLVIDANYPCWIGDITKWQSADKNNRVFPLVNQRMVIGDWFKLKKDKPTKIEVLIGECPGGEFYCQLLIEQKGKEYRQVPYTYTINNKQVSGTRPVLPIFKTKEIPPELIEKMMVNPDEATFDGPSFGILK